MFVTSCHKLVINLLLTDESDLLEQLAPESVSLINLLHPNPMALICHEIALLQDDNINLFQICQQLGTGSALRTHPVDKL